MQSHLWVKLVVAFAVVIVIASLIYNGTQLPMVAVIALCAIGALALAWGTLGRARPPVPAAAE